MTAKARELGIIPQGSNFLGCDQRNQKNSQLQDTLPSDLSSYDGVIFYNISGVNSVNTISLPAAKPAFMTAILQTGGGSNIQLTYQGSLQDNRQNGLWISIEGGGSNVSILSAPSGTSYSYTRARGGGSNVLLNEAQISEGNGVVR